MFLSDMQIIFFEKNKAVYEVNFITAWIQDVNVIRNVVVI